MRAIEFTESIINEYRGGSWREIRKWVPQHWPDYVVKDWLYNRISDKIGLDDKKSYIEFILSTYPVKQWKLETRKFGIHSFEEFTQRKILMRAGGTTNVDKVPRDKERHEIQQQRIQRTGEASQEPIICLQRPGVDGLELIEGWHRTVQNIKAFPDGYTGRAWIGYI